MKNVRNILLAFTLLFATISFGQTVVLADTNFRNKLLISYPQVMQNKQLLISAAASFTGSLDLRNAAITNASGVEYFKAITTLDLSNNQLTFLPDISGMGNLVNFYATNNQLVSLPNLSTLTKLEDFQIINNKLTEFPNLSGATKLKNIYCTGNKIAQFPSFDQFTNLEILVIGNNPTNQNFDFSALVHLKQLHVHKLNLTTVVGLEKLTNLQILYAWGNQISDFSALDSITPLTELHLFDNPLSQLPYLANKPNLTRLDISKCNFTFENILPIINQNPPTTFIYTAQRPFVIDNITARAENVISVGYPITNPDSGNTYVWLKDSVVIDSSASSSLAFNPLSFTDAGTYSLKVYNAAAPLLTLSSTNFTVEVKKCFEFNLPILDIVEKDCAKGYTINISNAEILGGNSPFTFQLNDGVTTKKGNGKLLKNVLAGKYELTIIDSKNCSASQRISLEKIKNCDPVLTPNGDGIADYYFIEKAGRVNIYDFNKTLVNTLQAPTNWDGTNRDGNPLDAGYYILIPEGAAPIYVTLIR